jgi:hypothetical protein
MGAAPAQTQQPAPDNLPVMAGGSADQVQPGNGMPSMQDLLKLASNPWAMQKYGPIIQSLLAQQMKQGDPAYALDLADKKVKLQLEQQQLGGNFRGDSMDAQAWNILQTAGSGPATASRLAESARRGWRPVGPACRWRARACRRISGCASRAYRRSARRKLGHARRCDPWHQAAAYRNAGPQCSDRQDSAQRSADTGIELQRACRS